MSALCPQNFWKEQRSQVCWAHPRSFKPQSCMYVCIKNLTSPSRKMAAFNLRHVRVISISYGFWVDRQTGIKWPRHHSIATLFWGALFANKQRRTPCLKWWQRKSPRSLGFFGHGFFGEKNRPACSVNDCRCFLLFIISQGFRDRSLYSFEITFGMMRVEHHCWSGHICSFHFNQTRMSTSVVYPWPKKVCRFLSGKTSNKSSSP